MEKNSSFHRKVLMHKDPPMQMDNLDSLLVQYGQSDLAIAINRNDTEIFSASVGHCDATRTQLIHADTLFGVASITKLVTSIMILLLQDRGQLSVLDSVNQYYPTLKAAANPDLKLHHLLSHTSGWPGMASRFHAINLSAPDDVSGAVSGSYNNAERATTRLLTTDDLVIFMNHQNITPLAEPGQLLSYSNEGFCLLGGIVEKITGSSWQQSVQQEIFKPLCMSHSTIGIPDTEHFNSIAEPIITIDTQRSSAGFWDAPLFYPAGGVVASVRDLLRLMRVLSSESPLLKPDSRAQLLTPALPVASRNRHFAYSLGLEHRQFDSGPIMHWHTGQRTGVSALLATLPASDLSLALLSNSSDAPLTAIAHRLIADLVNNSDAHWPPAINQPESATKAFCPEGQYGSDEGFSYLITQHDGVYHLCRGAETTGQVMQFQTTTSGTVGQQTFAFLIHNETTRRANKPDSNCSINNKPWSLALDLRVLPRLN